MCSKSTVWEAEEKDEKIREFLMKNPVNLVKVKRKMHNNSEWRKFVKKYGCGPSSGNEPTRMRY